MTELNWENCKRRLLIWISALGENGDTQKLKDVLFVAIERTNMVINTSQYLQFKDSEAYTKLKAASDYMSKIKGWFEKGEKIVADVNTIISIYEAMKVLQDDKIVFENPAYAAEAFDKLFIGFGTLAKKLPPPFNAYGDLLVKCGTLSFFGNMQDTMAGPHSNLGRAMYLRDHME